MYQLLTGLTGALSVVDAIRDFAEDVGFTVHRSSGTTDRTISISAFGAPTYFTLVSNNAASLIAGNMHDGIDTALAWNAQPTQYYVATVTFMQTNLSVTPINSMMAFGGMTPEPYLYFAIEMAPNHYRHINICHLVNWDDTQGPVAALQCSGVGGANSVGFSHLCGFPFVFKSTQSQRSGPLMTVGGYRTQNLAGTPVWARSYGQQSTGYTHMGYDGRQFGHEVRGINTFDQSTELVTPEIKYVQGGLHYDVGYPPNFRYINMLNLQPKDEKVLGPDTWKIFPVVRKLTPDADLMSSPADERSGNVGIAYLKI